MVLFAQSQFGMVLCMVALVVAVCFVLMRAQKGLSQSRRNGAAGSALRSSEDEKAGHHGGAPTDILRWEVAMHETARDLTGQLDSKLGTLQQLIREADRAAARLETALQAAGERARESVVPPRPASQAEGLRSASEVDVEAGSAARDETAEVPAGDQRYSEIYTLADYGYPAAEIAQRLGNPVGEIELILSLRNQR